MQNLNNFILNVLGQSNYVIINKSLMKSIGCHETILLSYMIDKWRYFNGEDFYYLIEDIMEDIPMFKERKLRETISSLIGMGILIKKDFKGAPPRQFYNIDAEKLFNIIASDANLKGFKKDGFDHCKNNTFNPCENAVVQYNINKDNNNRDNSIDFEKKVSNETYFSQSLVQNEILHDCERENKADSNLSPKPSENQTTSKKGRQGDLTLFESLPKRNGYTEEFETFWIIYRKYNAKHKAKAFEAYGKALKKGATHTQLLEAIKKQAEIWDIEKRLSNYTPHCSTWLNSGTYNDDFEAIKQQAISSQQLQQRPQNGYYAKEKKYSEDGYELDEKGHRINPDPTNNFFCPHGFYDNREEYVEFINLFPEGRDILDPEVEKADRIIEQNWLKEKARRREEKKRLSGN